MSDGQSPARKILERFERVDKKALKTWVAEMADEIETQRSILDHLREGVLLSDENRAIQYLNRAAANWLGISLQENRSRGTLEGLEESHLRRLLLQLAAGPDYIVEDIHLLNPRETYLRVSKFTLSQNERKLCGFIFEDRTHETAEQMNLSKIARIEALIRLAAGVAHEIGNPLNTMVIHLQLLKKGLEQLPEEKRREQERNLKVLQDETERLDRIVKNFVTATRKPPLRFGFENFNKILEDAMAFMTPQLKLTKVETECRYAPDLENCLLDRDRIYQIFINLIKNAMEAMPDGGILKITIKRNGKTVIIRFEDNGCGIRDEDQPHIFDAYYTTKKEGSGLGLMTVYNAVIEHGGQIEVESREGRGTVFTLTLPIRQSKLHLTEQPLDSNS